MTAEIVDLDAFRAKRNAERRASSFSAAEIEAFERYLSEFERLPADGPSR